MALINSGANSVATSWTTWLKLGAIALTVRVVVAVATGGLWHPEFFEYDSIARALLDGRGFAYTHHDLVYYSFTVPLFPWITAASYWLTGGSTVPLVLLQIAAGSALVVVTAAMCEQLFHSRVAGFVAGLLVGLHPGLVIYNATKAHPLSFDALLFTLVLWLFFRLFLQPTLPRAIVLGAVVGLGALSRSTTLVFFPIGALWLLAVMPGDQRVRVGGRLVAAGLVALAIIAPWSIRNTLIHHQFVLMQTTDSELLWRGNNSFATGGAYIDAEHLVLDSLAPDDRAELERQPDELAQREWFQKRAMAYIRANPGTFVRMTGLKLFHFWWFAPQTGVLYPPAWLRMYQLYYVSILILVVVGAQRLARSAPTVMLRGLLLALFLLGLSGLQSLYYVEGRHRWAVEPMLMAVAGGGAAVLVSRKFRAPLFDS